MKKSIYQQICDHLRDGELDRSFSLVSEFKGLPFAPGALDGIYMYHMHPDGLDPKAAREMGKAVKAAAHQSFPEADALFSELTKTHRAVQIVDFLQRYISEHTDILNTNNLFNTALALMHRSTHIECVKIGMEIVELYKYDSTVQEIIRRLGCYDEFTLYAIWNMKLWDNGNKEIFALAKKVHGWGRIHAIERLEPDSEEIRRWLLTEGTKNSVLNSYSSLTCWNKSKAEEILFQNPTEEEYKGISLLINGMLDEGPVKGISGLEDPEGILIRFLSISSNYALSKPDYEHILLIRTWAEERSYSSIIALYNELLNSPACMELIQNSEDDIGELAQFLIN